MNWLTMDFRENRPFFALARLFLFSPVSGCFIAALMFCSAGASVALATPLTNESAVGPWQLEQEGSVNKCTLNLRDNNGVGISLAIPAGCRHAMAILQNALRWSLRSDHELDLLDSNGKAILQFSQDKDTGLRAIGPNGDVYRLSNERGVVAANAPTTGTKPAGADNKTVTHSTPPMAQATPNATAMAMKPNQLLGHYNIFRGTLDSGCMLSLEDKPGLKGSRAHLAPACRDEGMVIFDPAGWTLEKGRLVLTARKGHQMHLDLQNDGHWLKDPREGHSLSIQKY